MAGGRATSQLPGGWLAFRVRNPILLGLLVLAGCGGGGGGGSTPAGAAVSPPSPPSPPAAPAPPRAFVDVTAASGIQFVVSYTLPPTGSLIVVAPLKIVKGTGSPTRVFALVPRS